MPDKEEYIEFRAVQDGTTTVVRLDRAEVSMDEVVAVFRGFLLATTFSPETVKEYLGND
jgi:hypothetical protein